MHMSCSLSGRMVPDKTGQTYSLLAQLEKRTAMCRKDWTGLGKPKPILAMDGLNHPIDVTF